MQTLDELGPKFVGLQASEETAVGATDCVRLMAALVEVPFEVTVMVAVCVLGIVPIAVAEKVADVAPAGIAIELAVDIKVLLSEIWITVAPLEAAGAIVTVQDAEAPAVRVAGVHCSPEIPGRIPIVPPVPVIFALVPLGKAAKTLLMPTESKLLVLFGAKLALTTATTPVLIA